MVRAEAQMITNYIAKALTHGRRPRHKSADSEERTLGTALANYICKSSGTYDPVFDKKIRELRPDWFEKE